MDKNSALPALGSLAAETRLDAFRLLVAAGEDGLTAGEIGEQLGVVQNTMSAHLSNLKHAELVFTRKEGRSVRYFASVSTMQSLLDFLLQDCCGGRPELCLPARKST